MAISSVILSRAIGQHDSTWDNALEAAKATLRRKAAKKAAKLSAKLRADYYDSIHAARYRNANADKGAMLVKPTVAHQVTGTAKRSRAELWAARAARYCK